MQAGLLQNAAGVGADGGFRDEERFGDDLCGAAAGEVGEHLGLATGEAVVVGEEREDDLFAVNSFGPIDLGGRRSADGLRNGRGAGRVGSCFVGCLDGCWGS